MYDTAKLYEFPTPRAFKDLLAMERKNFDLQLTRMRLAEATGDHQTAAEIREFIEVVTWMGYCPTIRAKAEVVCAYSKKPSAKKQKRKTG